MPTITVGKKWDRDAVYIGRPSPLGNPFWMRHEEERDLVCDQYDEWFNHQVELRRPDVMHELNKLEHHARTTGRMNLGCYCAPKRCHGDTIKRYLDNLIQSN